MNLDKDIDNLVKKIDANADKIQNNEKKIHQNTGALEILKTFKSDSRKFFIMWLITFIAFIGLLGYTIYILSSYQAVTTTDKNGRVHCKTCGAFVGNKGKKK
jgi:hypothetical protein